MLGWFAAGVNTVDNLSELHIDLQYDNYFVLFHNSIKWFYFFYMKAEIWSHILIFLKMINYQLLSNLLHKTVKSFKKKVSTLYNVRYDWIFTFHLKYFGIPEIYWKLTCSKMSKGHFIWFWGCTYSITM